MIDESIPYNEAHMESIEAVFIKFCSEMKQLKLDEKEIRMDNKFFSINWDFYYSQYRERCLVVCDNMRELANLAVLLCYERYPKKAKGFIWRIAGDGIIQNLTQQDILLPLESETGNWEYLGRKYELHKIKAEECIVDQ